MRATLLVTVGCLEFRTSKKLCFYFDFNTWHLTAHQLPTVAVASTFSDSYDHTHFHALCRSSDSKPSRTARGGNFYYLWSLFSLGSTSHWMELFRFSVSAQNMQEGHLAAACHIEGKSFGAEQYRARCIRVWRSTNGSPCQCYTIIVRKNRYSV